jgi:hypothetical protein
MTRASSAAKPRRWTEVGVDNVRAVEIEIAIDGTLEKVLLEAPTGHNIGVMEEASTSLSRRVMQRPVWYLPGRPLRTVWHGRRRDREDYVLVYGHPHEAVAVMTLFRGTDWPDDGQVVPYEPELRRAGMNLPPLSSFQDVVSCDGSRLFRTRLILAARGIEGPFTLGQSSLDSAGMQKQLEDLVHGSVQS